MSKHYTKPYIAAMVAILLGTGLMALEAKGAPLTNEAGCYAMAAASNNATQARYHRNNLKDYRHTQSNEVDYYIGYQMGRLITLSERVGIPLEEVAANEYDAHCLEKV